MAITKPIFLPALRGKFGAWVYYSAIMQLSQVGERIGFAHELHSNNRLGELIQRQLLDSGSGKRNRTSEISKYLLANEYRFFNAIVVGIYGGDPTWHPFDIQARNDFDQSNINYLANLDRVGFLELRGTERLFALDGQHRVAGIKRALENGRGTGDDIMTVLFVPHHNSVAGIQRTRRLFVDLNKRAVPVGTKDIIILDEVDLPAILARRLVDEHKWFSRGQVDIERFTSTIPRNSSALFSIATLYKVIKCILPYVLASTQDEHREIKEASTVRLPEERINYFYNRTIMYFEDLANLNQQLTDYFVQGPESSISVIARSANYRNVLFRPAGQIVFANAISGLAARYDYNTAFTIAQSFPIDMNLPPFAHVIWNPHQQKMISNGTSLATRLLKYMCDLDKSSDQLCDSYKKALQDDNVQLPKKLYQKHK